MLEANRSIRIHYDVIMSLLVADFCATLVPVFLEEGETFARTYTGLRSGSLCRAAAKIPHCKNGARYVSQLKKKEGRVLCTYLDRTSDPEASYRSCCFNIS